MTFEALSWRLRGDEYIFEPRDPRSCWRSAIQGKRDSRVMVSVLIDTVPP
jgi:hypothetical protein